MFLSIENIQFFSPNIWQMMTFLDPLDALIPKKSHFHFLPIFGVWVTSEARGSVSVRFWGSRQLSPFWGGGLAKGLYRPPPLQFKARPPQQQHVACLICMGLRSGSGWPGSGSSNSSSSSDAGRQYPQQS